jgi:hypothetical protein
MPDKIWYEAQRIYETWGYPNKPLWWCAQKFIRQALRDRELLVKTESELKDAYARGQVLLDEVLKLRGVSDADRI